MQPWIYSVIVERHDKLRPHHKQSINKICHNMVYDPEQGKKVSCEGRTMVKLHIRYWTCQKCKQKVEEKQRPLCDVPGCDLPKHTRVARVLSQKWEVNTQKAKLTSQVVLSEVPIVDDDEEAAKAEALEIASDLTRPLTLEMLNHIKRPVEHGYEEDEIIVAMEPFIIKHANRYCSHHFDMEDGIQQGRLGVMDTLQTDRAIAPFSNHAFRHIQTKVRRPSMTTGLIKHGERDCDRFGTMGIEIGTDDEGKKVYGSLRSADAQLADGVDVYDLKIPDNDIQALDSLIADEQQQLAVERVRSLIDKADLTPQQLRVLIMEYCLKDYMPNPYDPNDDDRIDVELRVMGIRLGLEGATSEQVKTAKGTLAEKAERWENEEWEHSGTEIAAAINCTRQRVGQQKKKNHSKLRDAADELGLTEDDL